MCVCDTFSALDQKQNTLKKINEGRQSLKLSRMKNKVLDTDSISKLNLQTIQDYIKVHNTSFLSFAFSTSIMHTKK